MRGRKSSVQHERGKIAAQRKMKSEETRQSSKNSSPTESHGKRPCKRCGAHLTEQVPANKDVPSTKYARLLAKGKVDGSQHTFEDSVADNCKPNWARLPVQALMRIFSYLSVVDKGQVAQVCKLWNEASRHPELWQHFEFVLGQTGKSYLQTTPHKLITHVLENHAEHLKFVIFKTDSSVESAESACRILSRLVNCSLKTLALISSAKPVFLDMDQESFVSALTIVFEHSRTLSSLAIDNTPVDDPSLEALASSNSRTLELLKMKSCPRVSPEGILALADNCRCLRELSLSYTLLSDELLLALSSEEHVRLENLRIDVYSEKDVILQEIRPKSWQALIKHSPNLNLVMYFFVIPDESFETLFASDIPVTHLYFGDDVPKTVLGLIGQHCQRLKELVVGANGNSVIDTEILLIARNCPQLQSLGLGECEITCSVFVEFARICGQRLTELFVKEDCLIEDSSYDIPKTCKVVSELIGREWMPEFMPVW